MKEFYWNEDTVDHFKFASNYVSWKIVHNMVKEFVDLNCFLEDGETEEELVTDLMNKIYETTR
tara:strand:- start:118 stop:306 length:189 start_codon:yes stop_codon:yes gene_type:complete